MLVSFLFAAVIAGTPLLFATLGELITEKAGNLNLGVEGMMLMGAVMGFSVGLWTGNPILAILGAILSGAFGALIYAVLCVTLRANQVVTGLSLTIFGAGFASFFGKNLVGKVTPESIKLFFHPVDIPILSKIPFIGEVLFKHDVFIYFGYLAIIIASIYLYKTRRGMNLRAVSENAGAADASGINVNLYKYVHIVIGGALCGLGGAYLSLVTIPVWQDGVTGGRGWIAVALVIFASWNPTKAMLGAFLFGGLDILGFRLQSQGIPVSQYLIDMLPYIATVVVLILSTKNNRREDRPPGDLGVPYYREER